MTVVEIEDVLSSIRRLVSEDLRPTHKLVSAALQKGANKLILTPALRIVSDVRTALPERGEVLDDAQDLGTVLNTIEVEEADQPAQLTPVFGSVRVQDPDDRSARDWATDDNAASYDANFLTTAMSRINGLSNLSDEELESRGSSDTIESVVAAVGAAVGPDEWEVDGGDPAPQTKAWGDAGWSNIDEPVEAAMPDHDPVVPLYLHTPSVAPDTPILNPPVVLDVPAEPSLNDALASNCAASHGEDQIIFRNDSAPRQDQGLDGLASADSDDEELDEPIEFLNEDILREIVRDMIREELQGRLGERITRNVRKLVRAEINRALAAHDFGDLASRA